MSRLTRREVLGTVLASPFVVAPASSLAQAGPAEPLEETTFPKAALVSVTSEQKKVVVEVRTSPEQPPAKGMVVAELFVVDAEKKPVDGLTVVLVPWMTSMDHGTNVVPKITARGGGRYLVTELKLFMAGRWDLRTTFHGPVDDKVVLPIDVK